MLSQLVGKLQSQQQGEDHHPGQVFMVASIFDRIAETWKGEKKEYTEGRCAIEVCLALKSVDAVSVAVKRLVEEKVVQENVKRDVLLAGLVDAKNESTRSVIAQGILDMYHTLVKGMLKSPATEPGLVQPPHHNLLIQAVGLVPDCAATFLFGIESYLGKLGRNNGINSPGDLDYYMEQLMPYLSYVMLRPKAQHEHGGMAAAYRAGLVRCASVNPYVSVYVIRLLLEGLYYMDLEGSEGQEEAGTILMDVVDLYVDACEQDTRGLVVDATVENFFMACLFCFDAVKEHGGRIRPFIQPLHALLPEYASIMMPKCLKIAERMHLYGDSVDGLCCYQLLLCLFSVAGSTSRLSSEHENYIRSVLDVYCLYTIYYSQDEKVRKAAKALSTVLGSFERKPSVGHGAENNDRMSYGMEFSPLYHWEDLPCIYNWIGCILSKYSVWTDVGSKAITMPLDEATALLGLLAHPSYSVKQAVLRSFQVLHMSEGFSFKALPVIINRIRMEILGTSQGSGDGKNSSHLILGLMYATTYLSKSKTIVPFIVRFLQPFTSTSAPNVVQAVATRVLSQIWKKSGKSFSSLKVHISGFDMGNGDEMACSPQQLAVGLSLVDIAEVNPMRMKSVVRILDSCMKSTHVRLSALALRSMSKLCLMGVLDYPKVWRVVQNIYPTMPTSEVVAAGWMSLLSCGILENPETHEEMIASVIEALWEAANHSFPLVRVAAYAALSHIDWDMAEMLDQLRPPMEFVRLFAHEIDPYAARQAQEMLTLVLHKEYEDRRRQTIQLSATLKKDSQQSRFGKLVSAVPKALRKQIDVENDMYLGSGDDSQIILILNVWQPCPGKKNSGFMSMMTSLLRDSNSNLNQFSFMRLEALCDGWKNFYTNWIMSNSQNVEEVDLKDMTRHKQTGDSIWMVLQKVFCRPPMVNYQRLVATAAYLVLFGAIEKQRLQEGLDFILGVLTEGYRDSAALMGVTSLSFIFKVLLLYLGSQSATECLDIIVAPLAQKGTSVSLSVACIRSFSRCLSSLSPDEVRHFSFDINSLLSRIPKSLQPWLEPEEDLHNSGQAIEAELACARMECMPALFHHKLDSTENVVMVLEMTKSYLLEAIEMPQAKNLLKGYISLLVECTVFAFRRRILDEDKVKSSLEMLYQLFVTGKSDPSLQCHLGSLLAGFVQLLILSIEAGYTAPANWNIDKCIMISIQELQMVDKYPHVYDNASALAYSLSNLLKFKMKEQLRLGERSAAEAEAEKYLEAIVRSGKHTVMRKACIPKVAELCNLAKRLKDRFTAIQAIESLPNSVIGCLSASLYDGQWPSGIEKEGKKFPILTVGTYKSILAILSTAERLPYRDWTACCRRILSLYPKDEDLQLRIVDFVCKHASTNIADSLQPLITDDILSPPSPQSIFMVPVLLHAVRNIHKMINALSMESFRCILYGLVEQVCNVNDRSSYQAALGQGFYNLIRMDLARKNNMRALQETVMELMFQNLLGNITISDTTALTLLFGTTASELGLLLDNADKLSTFFENGTFEAVLCIIQAFQTCPSDIKRSICESKLLFDANPPAYSMLSCSVAKDIGLDALALSRNHILNYSSDSTHESTKQQEYVILCTTYGLSSYVQTSQDILGTLSWILHIANGIQQCFNPELGAILCLSAFVGAWKGCTAYKTMHMLDSLLTCLPQAFKYFLYDCSECSITQCLDMLYCMPHAKRYLGSRFRQLWLESLASFKKTNDVDLAWMDLQTEVVPVS